MEPRAGSALAASRLGPGRGHLVRLLLELVRQRRELRVAARVRERVGEHAVGEPRVARQQRAVQVRAVRAAGSGSPRSPTRRRSRSRRRRGRAALRPGRGSCGRRGSRTRRASGPPRRTRAARRRSSASLPAIVCSGRIPIPGQLLARDVAVEAAEQLVPAADGEERRVVLDRLAERVRLLRRDRARRAPARGPARRRRRRGRSRRRAPGRACRSPARRARARALARARRRRRCCRGRRRCSGSRDRDGRRGSSCCALPVVRDVPARGDDLAHREHRGVGRENGQLAAGRASARARGRARARATGTTSIRSRGMPP